MATIRGLYEIRSYANQNYKLYYPRTGNVTMRTGNNDTNNYMLWFLWVADETKPDTVEICPCCDEITTGCNFYSQIRFYSVSSYDSFSWDRMFLYYRGKQESLVAQIGGMFPLSEGAITSQYRFNIIKKTTTTIDGITCDVVAIQSGATGYYLDATKAIANPSNYVTTENKTGKSEQLFVLYPSEYYANFSAPSNPFLQKSIGDQTGPLKTKWHEQSSYYPYWDYETGGMNKNQNFYIRTQDASKNNDGIWIYSGWTNWRKYEKSEFFTQPYKLWGREPMTILDVSDKVKEVCKYISLRYIETINCFGATILATSPTTTHVSYFAKKPVILKDGLAWTPEGLKINFWSDYFEQGTMNLQFFSILTLAVEDGKPTTKNILIKKYSAPLVGDSTITIPTEYFSQPPVLGDSLRVQFYLDTDCYAPGNYSCYIDDTVEYDEGNVDVTPTITELDGLKFQADVPYADTVRAWLSVDGQTYELEGTVSNGHTIFEIVPPFRTEYALFVSYENSDKTVWGTSYTQMPTIKIRAHVFDWGGGTCVIWLNKDEALQEEFTFSAKSSTFAFSGREHDVVSYLTNGEKNYTSVTGTIKGYIVPFLETYGTTKESIEKLVEAGHATYRAPYGRVCNVAVTDASITTALGITEVSISIIEEDI